MVVLDLLGTKHKLVATVKVFTTGWGFFAAEDGLVSGWGPDVARRGDSEVCQPPTLASFRMFIARAIGWLCCVLHIQPLAHKAMSLPTTSVN
jgi:hypothetical protein